MSSKKRKSKSVGGNEERKPPRDPDEVRKASHRSLMKSYRERILQHTQEIYDYRTAMNRLLENHKSVQMFEDLRLKLDKSMEMQAKFARELGMGVARPPVYQNE